MVKTASKKNDKISYEILKRLLLVKEMNTTMFFILEGAKETVLDFSQGTAKVL